MEEEREKLPSNYVTLAQLQERWLKEKERKQREKQEEEDRIRREEEDRKRREREADERKLDDRQNQKREPFWRNRRNQGEPFGRNRRNQSAKPIGVSDQKSEELIIAMIEVDGGETKIEDLNKKNKKKRNSKRNWKKNGKPREEANLIEGTDGVLPEKIAAEEEKIPVGSAERDFEEGGATSDINRNGENLVVKDRVLQKYVPVEIRRKFGDLSLNGCEKEGSERHVRNMRSDGRGYGNFNGRRMQSPRPMPRPRPSNSNMVWVRKGDTSDVVADGVQSSGVLTKAGEGQKRPAQMRPKGSGWRKR